MFLKRDVAGLFRPFAYPRLRVIVIFCPLVTVSWHTGGESSDPGHYYNLALYGFLVHDYRDVAIPFCACNVSAILTICRRVERNVLVSHTQTVYRYI